MAGYWDTYQVPRTTEPEAPAILYKLSLTEDGQEFLPLYQQGLVMQPAGFALAGVVLVGVAWWQRRRLKKLAQPILFMLLVVATLLLLGAAASWREVFVATQVWKYQSAGYTSVQVGLVYGLIAAVVGTAARRFWKFRPLTPTDEMFAAAAAELDSGAADKGVLARLSAKHNGNEQKTRAAYIRERAWRLAASGEPPKAAPSSSQG